MATEPKVQYSGLVTSTWLRGIWLRILGSLLKDTSELDLEAEQSSFGIIDNDDEMYFVQADVVGVDEAGRLVFLVNGDICAAVAAGEWKRVLRGITLDDVKAASEAEQDVGDGHLS